MMSELRISTDMISCFKSCIGTKNYKYFFDKHKITIDRYLDYFSSVSLDDAICLVIVQNLRSSVQYLEKFDPRYPGAFAPGSYGDGDISQQIKNNIKCAILNMDWEPFYKEYVPYIDHIIDAAREQKIINVFVEHDTYWYFNFSSRGPQYCGKYVEFKSTSIPANHQASNSQREHPCESRCSGEMLIGSRSLSNFASYVNRFIDDAKEKSSDNACVAGDLRSVDSSVKNEEKKDKMVEQLNKIMEIKLAEQKKQFDLKIAEVQQNMQAELQSQIEVLNKVHENKIQTLEGDLNALKQFVDERMENQMEKLMKTANGNSAQLSSSMVEKFEGFQTLMTSEKHESEKNMIGAIAELVGKVGERKVADQIPEDTHQSDELEAGMENSNSRNNRFDQALSQDIATFGEDSNHGSFVRQLQEQIRANEERLKRVRENRTRMNEAAAEERRAIIERINRGANVRKFFH